MEDEQSYPTICNLLKETKIKGVGRPKKKVVFKKKNLFDLGKGVTKNKVAVKSKRCIPRSTTVDLEDEIVRKTGSDNFNLLNLNSEAVKILETAENMGVSLVQDRESTLKIISQLLDTYHNLFNARYTWVGPLQRKSRLDRVLTSNNWPLLENWELRANPRKESDHKSLTFQTKVEEAMSWNREENEDVYKNIDRLELLISDAEDISEDERKLTMWKMELENQKLIRDQLLAQKAKIKWLKEELALAQSGKNKSPGPDGITNETLKKFWPEIKDQLLESFDLFFKKGILPQGTNSSFIVLIPKKDFPSVVMDFRPISLIYSSLKLLSKGLEQVENNSGMSEVMKGIMALSSNQAQRDLRHFGNYSWVLGNGRDLPQYKEMWTRELREWEKPIALELYELILNIRCNHKEDEARNEHIFKGTEISLENSFLLVQLRSFQWCLAAELIKSELDTLWNINPEGCILFSNKHKRRELFLGWNNSLVGYSDGSFKELEDGTMISGMRGILLNDKDEIIFVFSGKCNSSSPVEAELEAIIFLANAALTHLDHTSKVVICTDCALAIQSLSKLRAGQYDFFRMKTEWVDLASKKMIQLYYTPRDNLAMVDELAKKGRERSNILQSWV
ncbi:hypothetical protein POM88_036529 [Heracleum sosnowskyi]|uniref:RNase H type-1 domain-containing protein n=1 Tax=Heracleum sosnowskyi TaxID=360622 RepID=A0AAD8HQD6_9APIA|nr:hypothetical protein POM88_036529 [Heracleum sosnowskyi]